MKTLQKKSVMEVIMPGNASDLSERQQLFILPEFII